MARTRLDRKNDFENFYTNSVEIFTGFRDEDECAEKFERIYMLSVCPGSRNGGTNNRVVEIFWGSRPYESITLGRSWKFLTEYGVTLIFERNDNGYVLISLYPANTDYRNPIESSITLHIWIDPKKLNNKRFLKNCWNDFMAYMEYTSLDGNPTFFQRLRVSYLRYFKHLIIDKTWTPTKVSIFRKEILKYLLTVGLSGFIIYLVTILSQPSTNKTEQKLIELNKNLEIISSKLDSISITNSELKRIKVITDSIKISASKFLKSVDKSNNDGKKQ